MIRARRGNGDADRGRDDKDDDTWTDSLPQPKLTCLFFRILVNLGRSSTPGLSRVMLSPKDDEHCCVVATHSSRYAKKSDGAMMIRSGGLGGRVVGLS